MRQRVPACSLFLLFLAVAAHAGYPARGYQPRSCGLDMNRNGVRGELADCNVCDGVTTDPDGDGVHEDLIYVNCAEGVDTPTCGSPAPGGQCRTIDYAWNVRADGPGDGAEDIICFFGVCTTEELVTPGVSGVATAPATYTVAASGSEARAWQYPKNPTMLVGWDLDDDGRYPPVDTSDVAVIDGSSAALTRAFQIDADNDYLEMAHFTVRNYGRFTSEANTGFLRFGTSSGGADFLYLHDLRLERINQDRIPESSTITFHFFGGNTRPRWVQFSNILVSDNGGWLGRGEASASGLEVGPIRWQNITRTLHGCDVAACGASNASAPGFRLWGYMSGIEILDSVWDANLAVWQPNTMGGPTGARFLSVAQCSRDWMIRNNLILDHKLTLEVQGASSGFCENADARPVDDVVFDANVVRNTYEPWVGGDHGVQILEGGDSAGEVVGDVTISNNLFSSSTGWEAAIWVHSGHLTLPVPTRIKIINNTMVGDVNRYAAITLGNLVGADFPFLPQSIEIKNNLIAGLDADDLNVATTYTPSGWSSNNNVFDPIASFSWAGILEPTLALWRVATGGDVSSQSCAPELVNVPAGDFHLSAFDTCAVNKGVALAGIPSDDIDDEPRGGVGAWDVGADERRPVVFADGFELGGTGAWSATVP